MSVSKLHAKIRNGTNTVKKKKKKEDQEYDGIVPKFTKMRELGEVIHRQGEEMKRQRKRWKT